MNLVCSICTEVFVPSAEVNTTICGHMFHRLCLSKWLERSKTCPQCRKHCTEVQLIKTYFNVTANADTNVGNGSLLEKLDYLILKIRELEELLNTLTNNAAEHKKEQNRLSQTVQYLEEEQGLIAARFWN